MTGAIEYAQARMQARHGERASELLWRQLHAVRTFGALLESVRASALESWVSGIDADSALDEIELRLRERLRERIAEVARWMPQPWRPALLWTAVLIDLPALSHLASDRPVLAWMTRDPVLAPYALGDRDARRAALASGPFGFVLPADDDAMVGGDELRRRWLSEWQQRWPHCPAEDAAHLDALARLIDRHLDAFSKSAADNAWQARRRLQSDLEIRFRRLTLSPAAAFVHVALLALDVERLRAELSARAATRSPSPE